MRYLYDDAPRTVEQSVNLNKNTLENVALNRMFHPDDRTPSFIFNEYHCISCTIVTLKLHICCVEVHLIAF